MQRVFKFFLILICINNISLAGSRTTYLKSDRDRINTLYPNDSLLSFHSQKGYLPMLLHNIGEEALSPLHTGARSWCVVGAGLVVTGFLIVDDNTIDGKVKYLKQDHPLINTLSPQITEIGSSYAAIILGGIGTYSLLYKDNKALHTTLLATQAMITSGLWTRVIKTLASRERPSVSYYFHDHPGGEWYGPFQQYNFSFAKGKAAGYFDAFPSGHTSTAFSMATVFATMYNNTPVVPVIAYTTAALVGISRMTEHTHWASDVFVGACIGYLCGKQVVHHYKKLYHQENSFSSLSKPKISLEYSLSASDNTVRGMFTFTF